MRHLARYGSIACLIMVGAAGAQPSIPSNQSSPRATQTAGPQSLGDQLRSDITKMTLGTWWGGILVVKDGKTVMTYTHGLANEEGVPFDELTQFDIGDLSMQFTCVALLKLEQDGKLSIDDPVSKYYPQAPEGAGKVTLRQLMNHTAGFNDKAALPPAIDLTNRDSTAMAVLQSTPSGEPGKVWDYSKRGYAVLAAVIDKVSGTSFDEYLRTEVFQKAGMNRTGFVDGRNLDHTNAAIRVSTGRVSPPGRSRLYTEAGWSWAGRGSAGVITCLKDQAAWEAAFAGDRIISAAQRQKLLETTRENYGLGTYVTTTHRNTRRMWAGGASPGQIAISFRFVDEGVSVFVIGNEKNDTDLMAFGLSDLIFPPLPEYFSGELVLGEDATSASTREIPGPLEYQVAREGNDIRLTVTGPGGKQTHTSLVLSEGLARRLCAGLKDILRSSKTEGAQGTSITLDPRFLGIEQGGRSRFSPEARVEVRGFLRGYDPAGKEIREDRPVLAVIDPKAKGWPMVLRMDDESGQALYDALNGAITRGGPAHSGEAHPANR